jgi:hypothetical protein
MANAAEGRAAQRKLRKALVSRFRSSHIFAATSDANFGIKGTLETLRILVPLLNPKFATALAARHVRTSGSGH